MACDEIGSFGNDGTDDGLEGLEPVKTIGFEGPDDSIVIFCPLKIGLSTLIV